MNYIVTEPCVVRCRYCKDILTIVTSCSPERPYELYLFGCIKCRAIVPVDEDDVETIESMQHVAEDDDFFYSIKDKWLQ